MHWAPAMWSGLVDAGNTEANGIAWAVNSKVAAAFIEAWKTSPQPVSGPTCGGSGSSSAAGGSGGGGVTTATAADHAYADAVDDALIGSARTRRGLGELIALVNRQSISYDDASAAIHAITEQRRQLLAAVSATPAPPAFAASAERLKTSLNASIADDLAIASWIDAIYYGDSASADRYFHENIRLSAAATRAKGAFLARVQRSAIQPAGSRASRRPVLDAQHLGVTRRTALPIGTPERLATPARRARYLFMSVVDQSPWVWQRQPV